MGVFLPNCIEYPGILYGTAHCGGIVSTMNPVSTADEVERQCKDSRSRFLVTNSALLHVAQEAVGRGNTGVEEIVVIDAPTGGLKSIIAAGEKALEAGFTEIPWRRPRPYDTFIVPYSSGTSGLPKGVVLTHENLAVNMWQFLSVERFEPDDVFLAVLPFFHIYGMMIFLAAAIEARVACVVMPRFDLAKYLELIEKHHVTYLHVAPPIAVALAKHPLVAKHDLSRIRMVFSGAAPLGASTEADVSRRLGCQVKQAYGMTELSPMSHINPSSKIKPGTVGLLAPNCTARIVDVDTGADVPEGQHGELLIRGPNVMQGYLNRPEATAETITADGYLRTGDIASVDREGYYTIHDRQKDLIKYNGLQVAPAELEALLLTHPDVADACVVAKPDDLHGEVPAAFVVVKQGHTVTEHQLHDHVKLHAAPYKQIRGGIRFVPAIIKSVSGKILRREHKKML